MTYRTLILYSYVFAFLSAGFAADLPVRRPEADLEQDAWRKPQQVLAFFDIHEGMNVLEILSFGGYYTELLARAVGPSGKVTAQNIPFVINDLQEGKFGRELTERLSGNRLPNVVRYDTSFPEMELEPESFDAVTIINNYHDIFAKVAPEGQAALLAKLFSALKPGGTLGLIDHAATPGSEFTELHRVDLGTILQAFGQAGFVLVGESNLLRNPEDDRSLSVFDASVRHKTDRFVLRFKKP